jgi:5-methylcytosine-specific restriction protein A
LVISGFKGLSLKMEGDTVMIPKNITQEMVLKALDVIDREGVPKHRNSTKYNIRYQGKLYHPKYTLSLANIIANGSELKSADFSGGDESNTFLQRIGFEIYKFGVKIDEKR